MTETTLIFTGMVPTIAVYDEEASKIFWGLKDGDAIRDTDIGYKDTIVGRDSRG